MPVSLRPLLVFGDIDLASFVGYRSSRGTPIDVPDGHAYLCLSVLPMGWSWALYLAHTLMLEIFEGAVKPWASRCVEDGRPTPSPTVGCPTHWGYMDDFGAIVVTPESATSNEPVADMQRAAVGAFTALGVVPHRLTLGEGLSPTLGVEMDADRVLRIIPEKWWLLIAATGWVAEAPVVSVRALARLVSLWAWRFTIFRELYSVFSDVYNFLAEKPFDSTCYLWESVRQALRVVAALAPICVCPLHFAWSHTVLMTDASEEGFGVVSTQASPEEILRESRFAGKRGWVTRADAVFTMGEIEAEDDVDPGVMRGATSPQNVFEATLFSRPNRVVLHLFSGRRRAFDFEDYVEEQGQSDSHYLAAVSVDVQVDALTGDMANADAVEFWSLGIRRGFVGGMHGGPPCPTWSKARFNRSHPGARPVRSVAEPWGLAGLTGPKQKAVDLGNFLLKATLKLAFALAEAGAWFSIEHPRDAGPSYPSIWKLP